MSDGQLILFAAYLAVGPLSWLFLSVLTWFGQARMLRLRDQRFELPSPPPSVTILVPARNEGAGIRVCIERCLAQDYPSFDVIAVDDRSNDETGKVLDELATSLGGSKLRVIHIRPSELPDGWAGKCNALHRGWQEARGEWALFVDSDVRVEPHALRDVVAMAASRSYDAVSILTRLECHSFLERLVMPLAAGTWAVMNTVSLTNDDNKPHIAAANGQFFLIRRGAFESVGGHAAVYDQLSEDVELMRLMKARGFRVRFQIGSHLASTRMYATYSQMCHGWGRIYWSTLHSRIGRIILAMIFVLVCGFSVYPMLAWGLIDALKYGRWLWLAASVAHLFAMTAYVCAIYRSSGNRARFGLLFPIAAGALLGLLAFAIRLCRIGRVTWRGSVYRAGAPPVIAR